VPSGEYKKRLMATEHPAVFLANVSQYDTRHLATRSEFQPGEPQRFECFRHRERQILQFTAVEFGVVAIINGEVRLRGARQEDSVLAALPPSAGVFSPADNQASDSS
jgi:hypothetical protein